jgi:hypothetical protein
MILTSGGDTSFELHIVGYEFPTEEHDDYDSNWLRVRIDVRLPRGGWTSTDSCLLTWEVSRLGTWLDAIAHGDVAEPEQDFIEPNLRFELLKTSSKHLRIYFELECRPSWAPSDGVAMNDLWAEFEVTSDELKQAATSLRNQLKQFPVRAGGGLS